jgi:hypothetical protein
MKRVKKILLWTGISLGTLILILLIFAACYSWILGSRLEKKLAAIKAAGDPICLADLARKPIPPEQNGATYLRRAKDDITAVDNEISALWRDEGNDGYYPIENMKKIEAVFKAHANFQPLLEQAAACPDFDSQMDYTLSPNKFLEYEINAEACPTSMFRASTRCLHARVMWLIYQGDRDEAMRSVILMCHLSRLTEHEPLIINYLVSRAIEGMALDSANAVLQSGPIGDRIRADLDAELSLHDSMRNFQTALKSERAFALDRFRLELPRPWIVSNMWQISILDLFEQYLNHSLHPYSYWAAEEDMRITKFKSIINVFVELARPAFRAALIPAYRCQALVRAVRIINALQKKSPLAGEKIPTMAELSLPDEVGIDPFNGKAMIIKRLPEGWLVYSVGTNLTDDGGNFERGKDSQPIDVGFGPKMPVPQSQEKKSSK